MPIGSFCLVLHGHLPYVLRHGSWPHGEDWLYEAAAETYLPLLSVIEECRFLNAKVRLVLGLTPILLEQLAHEDFRQGFAKYLEGRIERANEDRGEFERGNQPHMAYLAGRWAEFYGGLGEQFARIKSDIPAAYAALAGEGVIELLSSAATHSYMPLLLEDSSVTAQLRAGLASSERILGFRPKGFWLPEGAYRPDGHWTPPISWGPGRTRKGIEHFLAAEGVDHFFVESHLIQNSRSEWVANHQWHHVGWDDAVKYPDQGWRNVLEPAWVDSSGSRPGTTAAFARDPWICQQVWSGQIGYPANGAYLEFHKKHGERRGLRYWKVTDAKAGLGDKGLYYPQDTPGTLHRQGTHFCNEVKRQLWDHHNKTGRHGIVAACFDAELFGHWWFEGPAFLREVLLTLAADSDVELCTTKEFMHTHPPDKSVSMPEGSWGEGGDHSVWTNDRINWMWEIEYRCEAQFGKLTFNLPWRRRKVLRETLEKAGRELLLLQASDWPFVISRNQAVDYGTRRFLEHVRRFETLADTAEKLAADAHYLHTLRDVERFDLQDAEIHDVVFPRVDLDWWNTT